MAIVEPETPQAQQVVRQSPVGSQTRLVWLVALASGFGGAAAGTAPTALPVADALFAALFAAAVAFAGSRARRWSWLVAAGVAATMAPGLATRVVAFVAIVVVLAEIVVDRRDRVVGAAVCAVAVQVLLRLDHVGPDLGSALVAAGATLPVLISGYVNARTLEQRKVRVALALAGFIVVIVSVGFAHSALEGVQHLRGAVSAGDKGIDALEEGDTEKAATLLDRSAALSEKAGSSFSTPFAFAAQAFPLLGHHVVATQDTAEASRRIARAASYAADRADFRSLAIVEGTVDLAALKQMREPTQKAAAALEEAGELLDGISMRWLAPPLADPIREFSASLAAARPKAHLAAAAIAAAPDMLGGSGPRRYFLAFASPAESRGLGGFVGYYGILVADGGRLELVEDGRTGPLESAPGWQERSLSGPGDFLSRYWRYQPARYLKNATATPDFPTTTEVLGELYPQTGGGQIDGVIYMDPYALAALLELTGPIEAGRLDLDAEMFPDFIVRNQYLLFPDRTDRTDLLGESAKAIVEEFLALDRVDPGDLEEIFGSVFAERRLMVDSLHGPERAVLSDAGVNGAFPRPDGSDFLSIRTANAGANKLDAYLHRAITYDVEYDPETGAIDSTATIELTNDLPSLSPGDYVVGNELARLDRPGPPAGTALVWLTVYSPLAVEGATVNGVDLPLERDLELGWSAYAARVDVPLGETVRVDVSLKGYTLEDDAYRLTVRPQPLVNADDLTVAVAAADGTGPSIERRAVGGGDDDQGFADSNRDVEVVVGFD